MSPGVPEDTLDNLPWFHELTMDERVSLLIHPNRELSQELVTKLKIQPGLVSWTRWENNPAKASLAGDVANIIREQRDQFDAWFDKLSDADGDYLIEHRNSRVAKEYLQKVDAASGPALQVLIESDPADDYSFELPPFARTYLEYRVR